MSDALNIIKLTNEQIAWRAAQDIQEGAYVNLGIGFPEMVARFQPEGPRGDLPHGERRSRLRRNAA